MVFQSKLLLQLLAAFSIFVNVYGSILRAHPESCNVVYTRWGAKISSEDYPKVYPLPYSCAYYIVKPEAAEGFMLNITVLDVDLKQDEDCVEETHGQCCTSNWLSLPFDDDKGSRSVAQICGKNETLRRRDYTLTNPEHTTHMIFHFQGTGGGRGFLLEYKFFRNHGERCENERFTCDKGLCVLPSWQCDGVYQCSDGTDEYYCPLPTKKVKESRCPGVDEEECGSHDLGCFNNKTQRCDGHRDCRHSGKDEQGCEGCKKWSMPCITHGCYHISEACDGIPHCSDFTDEADCGYCPPFQAACSLQSPQCFSPFTDRCNGKLDCPFGEDEVGCDPTCENSIACADGQGCYTPAQRCNLQMNCGDGSDEMHCQHDELHFECQTGGTSISVRLWCDGVDDCGDGSDERGCIKNSVITAAIMGSLLCGLLLVVAVGCTCRLYSLSMKGLAAVNNEIAGINSTPNQAAAVADSTPQLCPRHGMQAAPILLSEDEDFYFPEPPPAYAVAVGEAPPSPCPPYSGPLANPVQPRVHSADAKRVALPGPGGPGSGSDRMMSRSGNGRRSRRSGSSRRRPYAGPSLSLEVPAEGPRLPPYTPSPSTSSQMALPPYSVLDEPTAPPTDDLLLPEYAPPPNVKVIESLLRSFGQDVEMSVDAEGTSDSDALVGVESSRSRSRSRSPCEPHESIG